MATLLLHLWQSTLFLLVIAVAARFMRNAPARLLGALYWIGLLKLLLPLPWLEAAARPVLDALTSSPASVASASTEWAAIAVVMYPTIFAPKTGVIPPGVELVLALAWILGAAWFFLRGFGSLQSNRLERAVDSVPAPMRDSLLSALEGSGLAPKQLRLSEEASIPFVQGLVSPLVVVPLHVVAGLAQEELRAVLIHEAEHVRRRDPLRLTILHAIRALFFFYPPAWWLVHKILESTEMTCDEAVVRSGQSPATYCRSLARTLQLGLDNRTASMPVGALGHQPSLLLRRLERLRSGRRFEAMWSHRLTLAVAAVLALALSLLPTGPSGTLQAGERAAAHLGQLAEKDLEVELRFEHRPLSEIFEALQAVSRTQFHLSGEFGSEMAVVEPGRMPLATALERLAKTAGLEYQVLGPRSVEVRRVAGDKVSPPRVISRVEPVFPEGARNERRGGTVILQALIDSSGLVQEVSVLRRIPADTNEFASSAIAAVNQWRYEPARRNGEAVPIYFTIIVDFAMDSESPEDREPKPPEPTATDPV